MGAVFVIVNDAKYALRRVCISADNATIKRSKIERELRSHAFTNLHEFLRTLTIFNDFITCKTRVTSCEGPLPMSGMTINF